MRAVPQEIENLCREANKPLAKMITQDRVLKESEETFIQIVKLITAKRSVSFIVSLWRGAELS